MEPLPSLYASQTMQLKRKMTLDLDSSSLIKKTKSSLHTPSELLQSPDIQLIGIGSPEMERLILSQQNLPTPNLTNLFFPKNVTEEQEVYAKGFSDALDRLKQQNQLTSNLPTSSVIRQDFEWSSSASSPDSQTAWSEDQNSNSYEPSEGGSSSGTINTSNTTIPSAPIDMENQEKIKLERKRQRNRVAASKCRKRKLEKISKLEDKVNQLKRENADLFGVMNKLKDKVGDLKDQIRKHIDSGCNVMIQTTGTGNTLTTTTSNGNTIPVYT